MSAYTFKAKAAEPPEPVIDWYRKREAQRRWRNLMRTARTRDAAARWVSSCCSRSSGSVCGCRGALMTDQVIKQSAGKPDLPLVFGTLRNALIAMTRVREFGNVKYRKIAEAAGVPFDPKSWRRVEPERYLASAARHLAAVCAGERSNAEDGGVSHIAQAMVDLGFLFEIEAARATEPAPAPAPELEQEPECPKTMPSRERPTLPPEPPGILPPPLPALPLAPATAELIAAGPHVRQHVPAYLWGEGGQRVKLRINSVRDLPSLTYIVDVMSRKRRWSDQYADAISLARHSIMVAVIASTLTPTHIDRCNNRSFNRLIRSCLMHDAAEAPYGDIPTPRKRLERAMLPPGVEHPNDILTREFDHAMAARYDLDFSDPRIKQADNIACCVEGMARKLPQSELDLWFSPETQAAARGYSVPTINDPQFDAAEWWKRWRMAGGKEDGDS